VGALLFVATAGCLGVFGAFVGACLRPASFLQFCLAAYVVAWAGLVAVTVTLSIPGWLRRETLAVGVLVLAVTSLVAWIMRGRPPTPPWRQVVRDATNDVRLLRRVRPDQCGANVAPI